MRLLLERAFVDGAVLDDVLVEIVDGRFTRVEPGVSTSLAALAARPPDAAALAARPPDATGGGESGVSTSLAALAARPPEGAPLARPPDAAPLAARPPDAAPEGQPQRVPGLSLPGLANCHSHAFHRALRGHTQRERGSFWTWREQMYDVAARLDPDSYYTLAYATYREMAASGISCVGEFHYLHHQPGGRAYDDPNAMSHALVQAAHDAGIRITLLDTCYLSGGFGEPPTAAQLRFSDGDADGWAVRADSMRARAADDVVIGAAIHSVRAVPRDQLATVADWAAIHDAPLHLHLSEQIAENDACQEIYGLTPTRLLADSGVLTRRTSAVHATHLTEHDVGLLGDAGTSVCFCPTTERDLGDGIGPSRLLHDAGSPLTLGSDSHAVVDLFEEMRAVELDERLASRQRGHWSAEELLAAATTNGHPSLGFPDAGRIAVGQRADLVTIATETPRTAGSGAGVETAVFAAAAADVRQLIVDGRVVFTVDDLTRIGHDLEVAITAVRMGP